MNNLKRVLSLALSGIMLVGMMAVGAGAAEFTDAEDIQLDDAVYTLVALNVINGKEDGSYFDPTGDVTRAEQAKMIAVAMNGGNDTNTGVKAVPSFTDIDGHWAESYIEYCYDLGIISGRGDGTFDPEGKVTGMEAAKMVLTALGYDATAYKLVGASWAVRTDELARQADPSLYEELGGISMYTNATREVAAQLIWNGLQNQTRKVTPSTNTSTGEVTWTYNEGDLMLYERYGARVFTGIYTANENTDDTVDAGCIKLSSGKVTIYDKTSGIRQVDVGDAIVVSDLGIENIGEEIKVVFKDVLGGTTNEPDKKDKIYDVFNTGKTQVYNITKGDLQTLSTANKIKFGGSTYNMVPGGISIVTNYITDEVSTSTAANANLNAQSADTIKFVCDDEGRIETAYVVDLKVAKVTSVTSSRITLSAEGSIELDGNNVAEGLAKDDVVVFTKYYDTDNDEAFYTVALAETVEGEMTGFKFSSDAYQNVVVEGTTYKFHEPKAADSLPTDVADDAVSDLNDLAGRGGAAIGDTVRVYMVGGLAYAVEVIEQTGGNYAIITEVNEGSIDSVMDPLRVSVLLADGTEEVLTVHKDSTFLAKDEKGSGASAIKVGDPIKMKDYDTDVDGNDDADSLVELLCDNAVGTLIEYTSVSGGSIKIKDVFVAADQYGEGTAAEVWNEDTKKLTWGSGENESAVAASGAILFVGVDNGSSESAGDGVVDKYYIYDLRTLGSFNSTYYGNEDEQAIDGVKVNYDTNASGLVTAAYVTLNGRPGSSSADTLYGIVTGYTGSRQNSAGDDLYRYTVAVGRDEDVVINVVEARLATGSVIRIDETSDGEYTIGENLVVLLSDNDEEEDELPEENTELALAAVREYKASDNLLTYYSATSFDTDSMIWKGAEGAEASATVADDVKIFYVDGDDNAQGDETGVMAYDPSTGYANAILHFNNKDIVDVIIVETSGEVNMATTDTSDEATGRFGTNIPVGDAEDVENAFDEFDVVTLDEDQADTSMIPTTIPAGKTVEINGSLTAEDEGDAEKISRAVTVPDALADDNDNAVSINAGKPAVTMTGGSVEYGFDMDALIEAGDAATSVALYKFDFSDQDDFEANKSTIKVVGRGDAQAMDDGILLLHVLDNVTSVTLEYDADGSEESTAAVVTITVTFPGW